MLRIDTATVAEDLFGAGKDGFKDGDAVGGISATDLNAKWFNHMQEAIVRTIELTGNALSGSDYDQFPNSIKALIDAQSGNYALDTGAVNAYVVALDPVVSAYANGMTVRVRIVTGNTGASTLNAGGGVRDLRNNVGGALVNGDLPSDCTFAATFVQALNHWRINSVVTSQAMTQTAADVRYAALAGLVTQLFSVAPATADGHAVSRIFGDARYAALAGLASQVFNVGAPTASEHAVRLDEFVTLLNPGAGYVKIPVQSAGVKRTLILQWGMVANAAANPATVTLALTYPNEHLAAFGTPTGAASPGAIMATAHTKTLSNFILERSAYTSSSSTVAAHWLSLGW